MLISSLKIAALLEPLNAIVRAAGGYHHHRSVSFSHLNAVAHIIEYRQRKEVTSFFRTKKTNKTRDSFLHSFHVRILMEASGFSPGADG